MPDAPKKAGTLGGLKYWQWGLAVAGAGGVYFLYRRSRANAAVASQASTAGNTIPTVIQATGTSTNPTTLAQWIQAAVGGITNATYTPSQALNDIDAWLVGNCVSSAGVSALGGLVGTIGVPPGYTTLPTLTACAAPAPTPTPTPAGPTVSTLSSSQSADQQFYNLGSVDVNGIYTGRQVGGGAPVFATWNGQTSPVQDFNINQIAQLGGVQIWTPTTTPLSFIDQVIGISNFPGYTGGTATGGSNGGIAYKGHPGSG